MNDANREAQTSLDARHRKEEEFHNQKYANANTSPKHYDVNPTFKIFQRMIQIIGNVSDKRILEYGCGNGWMTAELAALGAEVDSFDISAEAVESTQRLLEKHSLHHKCRIQRMGAEVLEYPDNTFDIVFGFAILHHLDMDKAIPELYRVLKPGGYAIFAEPLEGNPGLKVYRALTPGYRTEDERPIVIGDFKRRTLSSFVHFEHEEFYLLALAAFPLVYIPGLGRFYDPVSRFLMALDKKLLKAVPFLGGWAWYSIFTIRK